MIRFIFKSIFIQCQNQPLPTTAGVLWTPYQNGFKKKVLSAKTSLGALQWITYLQDHSPDLRTTNGRVQIDHEYFRGEKKIGNFEIDGFAVNGDAKFFYEYNGCL